MKKKRVWRYYCEFCKKSGCSSWHMKKHEARCTNNPDRVCGMCELAGCDQPKIADLIAAAQRDAKNTCESDGTCSSDNLRAAAGGCPACMLAGARQSDRDSYFDFDYQTERKAFWKNFNDANWDGATL